MHKTLKFKLTLAMIFLGLYFSSLSFANISIKPAIDSSSYASGYRGETCQIMIDVTLDLPDAQYKNLDLKLDYDGEGLDIVKVFQNSEKDKYSIAGDRISYKSQNVQSSQKIFSLLVQSAKDVQESKIKIVTGSQIGSISGTLIDLTGNTLTLKFKKIDSCNFDIVSPTAELISPADGSSDVQIDSKVKLKIYDKNSGVDWTKTVINLDGVKYFSGSEGFSLDGNIVTIDPILEFAYGTSVVLKIQTQDFTKNKSDYNFVWDTDTNAPICQDLGCATSLGRQITPKECLQFQKMYIKSDVNARLAMQNLFDDLSLGCDLQNIAKYDKQILADVAKQERLNQAKKVSLDVFSVIGRLLFGISFIISIAYNKKYINQKKKFRDIVRIKNL